MRLLIPGSKSPKISHGDLEKYEAAILHLAPHTMAKGHTVCPDSTKQCRATCLYFAGRGQMPQILAARVRKTQWFLNHPVAFDAQLRSELRNLAGRAVKKGKIPVARLDGTSDLGLGDEMAILFPQILFYDYTKSVTRYANWLLAGRKEYENRYLTFSRSERNQSDCLQVLKYGGNVTYVFHPTVPKKWDGYPVINGDAHDFRFLDPPRTIVGLRAKGTRAKRIASTSGFVIDTSK